MTALWCAYEGQQPPQILHFLTTALTWLTTIRCSRSVVAQDSSFCIRENTNSVGGKCQHSQCFLCSDKCTIDILPNPISNAVTFLVLQVDMCLSGWKLTINGAALCACRKSCKKAEPPLETSWKTAATLRSGSRLDWGLPMRRAQRQALDACWKALSSLCRASDAILHARGSGAFA